MAKIVGEPIILKATFKDDSGNLTDPSTPVYVRIKDPYGNIELESGSASKQSTGVFTYTHPFQKAGLNHYSFKSSDDAKQQKSVEIEDDETE